MVFIMITTIIMIIKKHNNINESVITGSPKPANKRHPTHPLWFLKNNALNIDSWMATFRRKPNDAATVSAFVWRNHGQPKDDRTNERNETTAGPERTRIPHGWGGANDCQIPSVPPVVMCPPTSETKTKTQPACVGGEWLREPFGSRPSFILPPSRPGHTRIPHGCGTNDCQSRSVLAMIHPPTSDARIHMHLKVIVEQLGPGTGLVWVQISRHTQWNKTSCMYTLFVVSEIGVSEMKLLDGEISNFLTRVSHISNYFQYFLTD